MATVTVATVGSSASTTATTASASTTWLDVFPAYFYGNFGTPVGGSGTSTTVTVG